jgi:hypothetical protein
LLTDLFTTDYGLMSIIGIVMMIVGTGAFFYIVNKKMNADPGPLADKK